MRNTFDRLRMGRLCAPDSKEIMDRVRDVDALLEGAVWAVWVAEAVAAFVLRFDPWLIVVGAGVVVGLFAILREAFSRNSKLWDFWIVLIGPPMTVAIVAYFAHISPSWAAALTAGFALPQAARFTWKVENSSY